jgi:hypothetical protein
MADKHVAPEKEKSEAPKVTAPAVTKVPAAESSDPQVQKLLADRQTAVANGDDDAVKAVDKQLSDLGVSAQ